MIRQLALVAALVGALSSAIPGTAAPPADPYPPIAVSGEVQHALLLHFEDLQKLPQTTVLDSFMTERGAQTGTFSGPLLVAVVGAAGLAIAPGKNTKLRHTILVSGSDGYSVALSMGEIDLDYEGKAVILATSENGASIDPSAGVRLIVPNDKYGGRSVKQVTGIEVR